MFLLAVTREGLSGNFKSLKCEEFNSHSAKFTVITDRFLSDFRAVEGGFHLIESPRTSQSTLGDMVFSKISYQNDTDTITIDRPYMSGRPVYYHINHDGELFCSTHLSMLRKSGILLEENSLSLPEFFTYRYVMPPKTLYKNINQINEGSRLTFRRINGKWKLIDKKQYDPFLTDCHKMDTSDSPSKNVANLLDEFFKNLQPKDERIAILLSGGLDSSVICKVCQDNHTINTSYSTGYPYGSLKKNIEKEYAQTASAEFGTTHKYYQCSTNEYLQAIMEGISTAEAPLGHLQSALLYLLFKKGIPKEKNLLFSGHGADGIFGVNYQYHIYHSQKIYQILKAEFLYKKMKYASLKTGIGQSLLNSIENKIIPIRTRGGVLQLIDAHGDLDWVSKHFNINKNDVVGEHFKILNEFKNHSLYDDISLLILLGDNPLTQSNWSKLGESQGKILFYPYAQVLNYVYSLSWDEKLKEPKNILRHVARRLDISNHIITRPKSGFVLPYKSWAGKGGVFEPLVPIASKIFDEQQIRKMQSQDPTKAWTYWNILNYSIWKRLCINNEPIEVLIEELNEV